MMDQPAARLRRHVRHPYQVKDRQVLGIGSGDGVDRAQLPYPVGWADRANAANACIAVGGVRGIQLIATPDPLDSREVRDGILHRKGVVSGYSEDFGDADGTQT
jgi:hypothetical protein